MSNDDLQKRDWEVLSSLECDYCANGEVMIMKVIPHEQTPDDPYVDLQEWYQQGYYEAEVQCKKCQRNGLRWVKEKTENN